MSQVRLSLVFPVGALVAGARSKVWLKLHGEGARGSTLTTQWRPRVDVPNDIAPATVSDRFFEGVDYELEIVAPGTEGEYVLEVREARNPALDRVAADLLQLPVKVRSAANAAFALDPTPLSYAWGTDRGIPVHRLHLEQFLAQHSADIRGRCLEFQDPLYAPRFGGAAVLRLDILHLDDSNPRATIITDITKPNAVPDNTFDCVICTHVLHTVFHLERAVSELHRILAPGGVLLIGVPQISMCDRRYEELWRFTVAGLGRLLATAFAPDDFAVSAYGNSFTSAGELRGMIAEEFSADLIAFHDERFAAEICARAVKGQ